MKKDNLFKLLDTMYKTRKKDFLENYDKAKNFSLEELRYVNSVIKMDLSCTIFITIVIGLLNDSFSLLINAVLKYFSITTEEVYGKYISIFICAIFLGYFIAAVKKQTFKISILQDLQEDKKK